ncbi:MAG: hypothetical protein OI715_00075 (plasmid) [Candidatus Methanoperedens sp.]|nr:MAG: hypothetical protein OI715_00075 [Candidatus Methanoperedens sp.]
MKKNKEIKVVRVTPEDDEYIEELYKKITDAYKSAAALAGVNPTPGKKGQVPKIRHVVSFLREHAVFGDREIQNFAARFVK